MKVYFLIALIIGLSACSKQSTPKASSDAGSINTDQQRSSPLDGYYKSDDGFSSMNINGVLIYYESLDPRYVVITTAACGNGKTCTVHDPSKCSWEVYNSAGVITEGVNSITPSKIFSPNVFGCFNDYSDGIIKLQKAGDMCLLVLIPGRAEEKFCK